MVEGRSFAIITLSISLEDRIGSVMTCLGLAGVFFVTFWWVRFCCEFLPFSEGR